MFYTFPIISMASKHSFRPNLLDLKEKNDFASSMKCFWPLNSCTPKINENGQIGSLGPFDTLSYKTFLLKRCQHQLRLRFYSST